MSDPPDARSDGPAVGPTFDRRARILAYLAEGILWGVVLYVGVLLGYTLLPDLRGRGSTWLAGFAVGAFFLLAFRATLLAAAVEERHEPPAGFADEWRAARRRSVVAVVSLLVGALLVGGEFLYPRSGRPTPSGIGLGACALALLFAAAAYGLYSRSADRGANRPVESERR